MVIGIDERTGFVKKKRLILDEVQNFALIIPKVGVWGKVPHFVKGKVPHFLKVNWFRKDILVSSILPKMNENKHNWGIIVLEVELFHSFLWQN